ncbi:MAG TPA: hypothetical protein VGT78_12780 [Rhizomicrobium sp.]|nr:hypothetical protein [Rhizomicrobium sp.]
MDDHLVDLYLMEIEQHLVDSLDCIARVNQCLQILHSSDRKNGANANSELFRELHAFANHAASASRVFWPGVGSMKKESRERAEKRAIFLRALLDLDETHELAKRTLRNSFEHYDEALDDWAENSRNRNIVIQFIGPPSAIGGDGIDASDIFTCYNPQEKIFYFRGQQFDIQKIVTAINALLTSVQNERANVHKRAYGEPLKP